MKSKISKVSKSSKVSIWQHFPCLGAENVAILKFKFFYFFFAIFDIRYLLSRIGPKKITKIDYIYMQKRDSSRWFSSEPSLVALSGMYASPRPILAPD